MKSKSKKILIIVVSVVLVVALAGTGIFFTVKNGGDAVKVCLVSNMSSGFWGGSEEISSYGNVTTNMNQDIYCDDTLTITQVYVQEGDSVKAGDPLVAYDTTLLSLELEMKQMEIDGLGLQMRSVQEEIRQLRGMNPASTGRAALDNGGSFYNVASSRDGYGFMKLSNLNQPNGTSGENPDTTEGDVGAPDDGSKPGDDFGSSGTGGTEGDNGNSSGTGGEQPGGEGEGGNTPDNPNPPSGDNPPGGNDTPFLPPIGEPFPEELRDKEIHTMISAETQAYNQEEADGSAENPYRFLCAPGVSVDVSFMTNVLASQAVYVFQVVDNAENPTYILYSWMLDGRIPESDDPDNPIVEPDMPMGPTYEEIQRSIKEKEEQLKELDLSKRTAELELRKMQKKMDNGVVTSTVDGTVKSVLDEETAKLQGSPMISVVGEEGFYITGTVAETALDKLPVGTPITVSSWSSGGVYEATVTGVSNAPTRGYYGNNPNMSYYPFTAVIKGDADLRNGEGVDLSVDGATSIGYGDEIYLEQAFIREEGNQYYVYKKGEDGRLTKQYVEVGKIIYGSYQILSGLTQEDEIAFPYGKDVKEGAKTESVDSLYEY